MLYVVVAVVVVVVVVGEAQGDWGGDSTVGVRLGVPGGLAPLFLCGVRRWMTE